MEAKKRKQLWIALGVYLAVFLLILLISNIGAFQGWINGLLRLFRPLIIGLVIAYLCNPFFRFFERKLFFKIHPISLRRAISLLFTYLVLFLIVGILLMLIVPQLMNSIMEFIEDADQQIDQTVKELNNLITTINQRFPAENGEQRIPLINVTELKESLTNFFKSINLDSKTLLAFLNASTINSIFDLASNVLSVITDTIFGLFISLYLLNTKEKRYAQIMRLRKAFFSDTINERITTVCTVADKSFGGFIRGKLLDSTMVGILVYIIISTLNVPYAILIAVIVGITDIVPVIGPFIGVIPSAVIILLTDPSKVIPFLLCILIVQQIDGNILAPKILGENTGVSSLCVMIAITTMGTLWGLVGMVIGVPLFATVLELTNAFLDKRLREKGISPDTFDEYTTESDTKGEEETWIRKFQKKRQLHLQQNLVGGEGDLTPMEHFQLETYALAHKYEVLSPTGQTELPEEFLEAENELVEATQEQIEAMIAETESESENTESDDSKSE